MSYGLIWLMVGASPFGSTPCLWFKILLLHPTLESSYLKKAFFTLYGMDGCKLDELGRMEESLTF
jgi:hypothetical protein